MTFGSYIIKDDLSDKETLEALYEIIDVASDAYYSTGTSIMSDKEYDEMCQMAERLEKSLGLESRLTTVGAPVKASKLKKVKHEEKALSLDKTKDRDDLASWLGNHEGVLSWKCDGLTLVASYDNGKLTSLVTRGNGEIGEDVTHNAPFVKGLPMTIPMKEHLVVRGECIMTFEDFENVNETLPVEEQYKNPRNLASGTIRALDPFVVKERGVGFKAFELVTCDKFKTFMDCFKYLDKYFDVVEHALVTKDSLPDAIEAFEAKVATNPFPTDGLVLQMNDIESHALLGTTGKFPKYAKAFKWQDELATTVIRDIVWQPSRTGLINPVAVFDPVELEGTTVSRATCNNLSFMNIHKLHVGATIEVYKANMIIPTIYRNVNEDTDMTPIDPPKTCPCCGKDAYVVDTKESQVLMCKNPDCSAKNIQSLMHFVKRDAMNIMGVAESTIELLNSKGLLKTPLDFFTLKDHPEIADFPGFGEGSYKNLIDAIETAKDCKFENYLYAWGIPQIGRHASKDIAKEFKNDIQAFINAVSMDDYDFSVIDGFGDILCENLKLWWNNPTNRKLFEDGVKLVRIAVPTTASSDSQVFDGKTFCITGSLELFENRSAMEAYIANRGGKVAGSVSKNTDYLITNDTTSGSSKNKKAAELGKPIITEQQLIDMGGKI